MNPGTANLVSYWSLEEASGTRADSHGSNDLTDNNTVTNTTGIQGNAAVFDNANSEFLNISDGAQSGLDLGTGVFGVSFWCRTSNTTDLQQPFMKGNAGSGGSWYGVYPATGPATLTFGFACDNGTSIDIATNSTTINDGSWHHIVATRNGSNLQLYVDNGSPGSGTDNSRNVSSSQEFAIGYRPVNNIRYWDGEIDEFGIWTMALSADHVSWLYNSGSGRTYSDISGGGGGNAFIPRVVSF